MHTHTQFRIAYQPNVHAYGLLEEAGLGIWENSCCATTTPVLCSMSIVYITEPSIPS